MLTIIGMTFLLVAVSILVIAGLVAALGRRPGAGNGNDPAADPGSPE